MSRYRLFTPRGVLIIGVNEVIPCLARVDSFDAEGNPDEYGGESTLFWDDQRPASPGNPIYVCANGHQWRFSELTPVVIAEETDEDTIAHLQARGKL
jgi:hypothetical protein